jgi:hypothetical protein
LEIDGEEVEIETHSDSAYIISDISEIEILSNQYITTFKYQFLEVAENHFIRVWFADRTSPEDQEEQTEYLVRVEVTPGAAVLSLPSGYYPAGFDYDFSVTAKEVSVAVPESASITKSFYKFTSVTIDSVGVTGDPLTTIIGNGTFTESYTPLTSAHRIQAVLLLDKPVITNVVDEQDLPGTFELEGTGQPGDTITVVISAEEGNPVGGPYVVIVDDEGKWEIVIGPIEEGGDYDIDVTETDLDGNESSTDTITVTIVLIARGSLSGTVEFDGGARPTDYPWNRGAQVLLYYSETSSNVADMELLVKDENDPLQKDFVLTASVVRTGTAGLENEFYRGTFELKEVPAGYYTVVLYAKNHIPVLLNVDLHTETESGFNYYLGANGNEVYTLRAGDYQISQSDIPSFAQDVNDNTINPFGDFRVSPADVAFMSGAMNKKGTASTAADWGILEDLNGDDRIGPADVSLQSGNMNKKGDLLGVSAVTLRDLNP